MTTTWGTDGMPDSVLGKNQEGNALLVQADRLRDQAISLFVAAAGQEAKQADGNYRRYLPDGRELGQL